MVMNNNKHITTMLEVTFGNFSSTFVVGGSMAPKGTCNLKRSPDGNNLRFICVSASCAVAELTCLAGPQPQGKPQMLHFLVLDNVAY